MKSGETNLEILLKNMSPILNEGDYVFCETDNKNLPDFEEIILFLRESENITLIVERKNAEKYGFDTSNLFGWITLQIHSSLEAVGLTAAFSNALATKNISCNVVAGYYHDHIFVPKKDISNAIKVLKQFAKK